jgi:hypothetical protein
VVARESRSYDTSVIFSQEAAIYYASSDFSLVDFEFKGAPFRFFRPRSFSDNHRSFGLNANSMPGGPVMSIESLPVVASIDLLCAQMLAGYCITTSLQSVSNTAQLPIISE